MKQINGRYIMTSNKNGEITSERFDTLEQAQGVMKAEFEKFGVAEDAAGVVVYDDYIHIMTEKGENIVWMIDDAVMLGYAAA